MEKVRSFTAIDFETASSFKGSACALGLAKVENGRVVKTFSTLLKPVTMIFSPINIGIHGIRPIDVQDAPGFKDRWAAIRDFIGDDPLVAHNASFDCRILREELTIAGLHIEDIPFFCTYKAGKRLWLDSPSFKLSILAEHLGVTLTKHHEAEADAVAAAMIMLKALKCTDHSSLVALYQFLGLEPLSLCTEQSSNTETIMKSDLDKSLNSLEGLLTGISLDRNVSPQEATALSDWFNDHLELETRHPYSEVMELIRDAFDNNKLPDIDAIDELITFCRKIRSSEGFFAAATADIQILLAMLGGIASDGDVKVSELEGLKTWASDHAHLKKTYPFQDVMAIIDDVLQDGVIDQKEQQLLNTIFADLAANNPIRTTKALTTECTDSTGPTDIWSTDPVTIPGHVFVFTGESTRASRPQIQELIVKHGGTVASGVSKKVDYLVVGEAGNPCWAFSSYGTKMEKAMGLQGSGAKIRIVKEPSFWEALT